MGFFTGTKEDRWVLLRINRSILSEFEAILLEPIVNKKDCCGRFLRGDLEAIGQLMEDGAWGKLIVGDVAPKMKRLPLEFYVKCK